MKNILKRIAVWLLIILLLLVLIGSVLVSLRKDMIRDLLIRELNDQLSTTVQVEQIKLGFIQNFPNVTARFQEVLVTPPPAFISSHPITEHDDTLAFVKDLHILLNPIKLLQKQIDLKRLSLRHGMVYLAKDQLGTLNYRILKSQSDSVRNGFVLAVEQIVLKDMFISYLDNVSGLSMNGYVPDFRLNFRSKQSIHSKGDLLIESIDRHNKLMFREQVVRFNTIIHDRNDTVWFDGGQVDISGFEFLLSGNIDRSRPSNVNIFFSANNKKLNTILHLLPQNLKESLEHYRADGYISLEGELTGPIGKGAAPTLRMDFQIGDGLLRDDRSGIALKDMGFSGSGLFTFNKRSDENMIDVRAFRIGFNKEVLTGAFSLHDLTNPKIEMALSGNIDLDVLNHMIGSRKIAVLSGKIRTNLRISGKLNALKNVRINDLELFDPVGHLELHDVSFRAMESSIEYTSISGSVMLGTHFWLDGISLRINDNPVFLTGELRNMLPYLNGHKEPVLLKATLHSPDFDLTRLLPGTKNISDETAKNTLVRFPENILANIEVEADRFTFRTFSSERFKGLLLYEPGIVYLDSLSFRSMQGSVKGHGVVRKKSNELFDMQVYADLRKIDITDMFYSFNNFGQKFIVDDNLNGQLTGDVYFYSDWTMALKVVQNSIIADAHFLIENGELIGFEPIQSLSKYLAVKELEHIHFSTLENEIFINEEMVTIPVMDIASSAFTITASGTHHFNNQFEYNLKVLLSDILATKARKARSENSEFGIIEDDGLGRTSLYFKVTGIPGNVDVAYDEKAMLQSVKSQLKNEGQNLRQILSEEFGKTRPDSVSSVNDGEKKKFRIRWDESESVVPDSSKNSGGKKFNISWEEERSDTTILKKK